MSSSNVGICFCWLVCGVSGLCQLGEAEALGSVFSFVLVPPGRWDRGDDVGRFCNEVIVMQVTGIFRRYCAYCLFNIVGLLSSASQLELGANVDPCEPVLTARLSPGSYCCRLCSVVDVSCFCPCLVIVSQTWTVRPGGTGCRSD